MYVYPIKILIYRIYSPPDEGGAGVSSDERSDSSEDEVTEHVTARSTPPPDMAAARAQVTIGEN